MGRVIAEKLRERGCQHVFTTGKEDGDLTDSGAVRNLLATTRTDTVVHLAAMVGGIGANREHPAESLIRTSGHNLLMRVGSLE